MTAVQKTTYKISERANPERQYIVSPSGLVGEIISRRIIGGWPIRVRFEHGGIVQLDTTSTRPKGCKCLTHQ